MNKSIFSFALIVTLIVSSIAFVPSPAKNPHGKLKIDCKQCHTTATWKIDPAKIPFRHSRTGFMLLGSHKNVQCMSCHQSLVFSYVGTACADCHTDVHRGQLGITCQECHNSRNWENRSKIFEQHNASSFPLLGMHSITDCEACHVNQQQNEFANTPTDCEFCHQPEMAAAVNPNHKAKGLTSDCQRCHMPTAAEWNRATFQHQSAFIDRGAHAGLECQACHTESFSEISSDCFYCHEQDYNNTTDPPHAKFNMLTNCVLCHNETRWEDALFDHAERANFELRGAHSKIKCNQCHVNNKVTDLPRDCYGCHQTDFNAVTQPSHKTNNFDHDCLQCHTDFVWTPSTFDHNNTQFQLVGAHRTADCIECHQQDYVTPLQQDCFSCHQQDFETAADPSHVDNNFDHDCLQCHDQNKWTPSTFDHNTTQFPLIGAHKNTNCVDCHSQGYKNTAMDCFSCHEQDFTGVTDPNHVNNNFDHDCLQCHDQNKWTPAFYDHNNTQFPLIGAHQTVACADCHSQGYTNTPMDCFSCHEQDFTGVTDPNHVDNKFDHDCTVCHDQSKWTPAFFDHNNTQFPLLGAHQNVVCADCHSQGYNNTPSDCFSCHETDFTGVTDPNHATNKFDHDCTICHDQNRWKPATFDHNTTQFPLTGGHANVPCADCHANGYANTAMDCNSCHKPDYDKTTNPNHLAASFPTTCEDCHKTTRWEDTTWDHDNQYFPIYSGKHRNKWNTCLECHRDPNDFETFSCIDCHEHNRTKMDDKHSGERDYVWESNACLHCHPQGKE